MCFYGLLITGDPEQFTGSYREQKLDKSPKFSQIFQDASRGKKQQCSFWLVELNIALVLHRSYKTKKTKLCSLLFFCLLYCVCMSNTQTCFNHGGHLKMKEGHKFSMWKDSWRKIEKAKPWPSNCTTNLQFDVGLEKTKRKMHTHTKLDLGACTQNTHSALLPEPYIILFIWLKWTIGQSIKVSNLHNSTCWLQPVTESWA